MSHTLTIKDVSVSIAKKRCICRRGRLGHRKKLRVTERATIVEFDLLHAISGDTVAPKCVDQLDSVAISEIEQKAPIQIAGYAEV
jgi:hypothetical protein